jgi:hypothetical protein
LVIPIPPIEILFLTFKPVVLVKVNFKLFNSILFFKDVGLAILGLAYPNILPVTAVTSLISEFIITQSPTTKVPPAHCKAAVLEFVIPELAIIATHLI